MNSDDAWILQPDHLSRDPLCEKPIGRLYPKSLSPPERDFECGSPSPYGSKPKDTRRSETVRSRDWGMRASGMLWIFTSLSIISSQATAQIITQPLQVTVTIAQDGPVQADNGVTLREAIEIINGTLPLSALSEAEKTGVVPSQQSVIRFALPTDQTTLELKAPLPALAQHGLTIDGTTQPGYGVIDSTTTEDVGPVPIVAITPATGVEVLRGLSLVANNITIRGLSLYGFTAQHRATAPLPPADIFIAHPGFEQLEYGVTQRDLAVEENPPRGIVIEQNWLGLSPQEILPEQSSAFGVFVFNSTGVSIRQNQIAYHEGSGIISGIRAENLEIVGNQITQNGLSGMPDAIRLEGSLEGGLISDNLIADNAGSGIFLFKPEGTVEIRNNILRANGQRYRRAAIYLMGHDHQVIDNVLESQNGPGVVVTAYSQGPVGQSWGNVIVNNTFGQLQGLSIDLNTRRYGEVQAFQMGDGPNPQRESENRRRDTANGAINAPQFLSREFFIVDGQVILQGKADPGTQVQVYLSQGRPGAYGSLSEPVGMVRVDAEGRFSYVSTTLGEGDVVSAIATDPHYGTSEPALNAGIRILDHASHD
jgi:hypothetical protein